MLRLSYFPVTWKFAQIVMRPKPGKPANEASSYRPISLLPITSKIFEKLLQDRVRNDTDILDTIPDYHFGFREYHSTIQQTHRIVNKIAASLEGKQYCTATLYTRKSKFNRERLWAGWQRNRGLILSRAGYFPLLHTASYLFEYRVLLPLG
jgi:hypothetical protein